MKRGLCDEDGGDDKMDSSDTQIGDGSSKRCKQQDEGHMKGVCVWSGV